MHFTGTCYTFSQLLFGRAIFCNYESCIRCNNHSQTQRHVINRGSYMSAHVLLHTLNMLGKRDKMRGLPSILFLFRNEFNKFNNTRARL